MDGDMCFERNLLTPATPSKIVVLAVAFTAAGSGRVLGAYVTDGRPPDPEAAPNRHPVVNVSTGYGEPLIFSGLNAFVDLDTHETGDITVPVILDFRRQMMNVTFEDSDRNVLLRYDVSGAVNA